MRKIYAVKTSELLQAATFLSTLEVTLTIPEAVCCSYRRAVAAGYSKEALGSLDGPNCHIYFIWVLEESHRSLESFLRVQSDPRVTRRQGDDTVSASTGNIYDALSHSDAVAGDSGVDSDVEFVDEDLPLPGASGAGREQTQYTRQ